MSLRRLQQRVPQVRPAGRAILSGHRLCFHKIGADGSAKCDAFFTGCLSDIIHGVLYSIEPGCKAVLDRIEGLGAGYDEKPVVLTRVAGGSTRALTYVATHIDASLQPFDWYKQHVLVGAREAGLPRSYVDAIERRPAHPDPDRVRHAHEIAVHG
jgi:hypothetical protein